MFFFNTLEVFILGITLISFILLLIYYLVAYARPLRPTKNFENTENNNTPPVSIIIYAQNDSENLKKNLPSLLSQNYPEYQVVVINDGSNDDTDVTLKFFENGHKNLYHTYVPSYARYLSRRKLAFTLGAKAAKNDILIFTESYCKPISDKWLLNIVKTYTPETNIVLGFCKYGNYDGFMHKLIAYDNLLTGLRYLSSVLFKHPYTGNGRNLSYRKDLFFKNKGYYKSLNLQSGDDDLFINETATAKNTKAIYVPESLTEMDKIEDFRIWKGMKYSRATTQKYHKGKTITFYHLETSCFILFQIACISTILLGISYNWRFFIIGILLYIARFIIKAIVINKASKMLQQCPNLKWLFLLEFVQPIFNTYVHLHRLFKGSKDYTFRLES